MARVRDIDTAVIRTSTQSWFIVRDRRTIYLTTSPSGDYPGGFKTAWKFPSRGAAVWLYKRLADKPEDTVAMLEAGE